VFPLTLSSSLIGLRIIFFPLSEMLNYADADSCNKSIVTMEKAFQEAVQATVEEKLKGGTPPKKAPSGSDDDLAKQVEKLMMGI